VERFPVSGVKVYQLDICEAIGDHHLCPGITTLKAGDHEIGTVAFNCACHRKPETELPQLPQTPHGTLAGRTRTPLARLGVMGLRRNCIIPAGEPDGVWKGKKRRILLKKLSRTGPASPFRKDLDFEAFTRTAFRYTVANRSSYGFGSPD
jgi:hypothetical protein